MKNKVFYPVVFVACLLSLFFGAFFFGGDSKIFSRDAYFFASISSFLEDKESVLATNLSQEELADLIRPSIVRIVHQVKGEVKIPFFVMDLENLKLFFPQGKEPITVPVDTSITGSGFIVNPDGYILTNAHVVSDETIKNTIAAQIMLNTLLTGTLSMSPEDQKKISKDEEANSDFFKKTLKDLVGKSTFSKTTKTITVLNPSSKKDNIADFIKDGFQAKILKVNDGFFEDEKDIALIKIEKNELPALKIGNSQGLVTGKKVFVFGFPATAEFNINNFTNPTFTQGTISAIKDSANKDFKIFQTDAKVSQGSSGGPLFDDRGDIMGLITFQSNTTTSGVNGDNFAFAIPIEVAQSVFNDSAIENKLGNYNIYFKEGLALSQNRHCKKAIENFRLAKKTNENFGVDKYIDPYIKKCEDLIASGGSIDTVWDRAREWLKGVDYLIWVIIVGGVFIFIVLVFIIAILRKKLKKEEKEIDKLENRMEKEEAREAAREAKGGVLLKEEKEINLADKPEIVSAVESSVSPKELKERVISQKQSSALNQFITLEKTIQKEQVSPRGDSVQIEGGSSTQTVQPLIAKQETESISIISKYIAEARMSGLSNEAIVQNLKNVGWPEADIQKAFKI